MTRLEAVLGWLERASDRLSPIVVKEVRQLTRGREFHVSFGSSLLIGLAIASVSAADALTGTGTSGGWAFGALMGCLGLLGLGVVPLGAFNALRNERLEQTLELITLTALSPRRVVIGKLMAQAVKLATLFAGLAPFVAMSFLLGGIDFVTVLVSMAVLFMWSLWASAACLFLSSLFRTRAMSGALFGGVAVVLFLLLVLFGASRALFFVMMTSGAVGPGGSFGLSGAGSTTWWVLAIVTTFGLASLVNLVLLAENRLTLASENRITPLRIGLLVQFLLIVAWTLSFINEGPFTRLRAANVLIVFGGIHIAMVALFAVTEDLVLPRRVRLRMQRRPAWQRLFAMFLPGGGRGAIYILLQMGILLGATRLLAGNAEGIPYLLALCGYICFYTGVPAAAVRVMRPYLVASFQVRIVVLVLLPIVMLLPDIIVYMWNPAHFDGKFSVRHLIHPIRTLMNWDAVEDRLGFSLPTAIGLIGLLAYAALIHVGMRMPLQPAPRDPQGSEAAAGAPRGANILY